MAQSEFCIALFILDLPVNFRRGRLSWRLIVAAYQLGMKQLSGE